MLLLASLCLACKKDPKVTPDPVGPVTVPVDTGKTAPIKSTKFAKIDSIRKVISAKATYDVLSDSVWADSAGITFRVQAKGSFMTNQFSPTPLSKNRIYPGSLLKGNTILNQKYEALTGYPQNAVTIYSSLLSVELFSTAVPSLGETTKYIKAFLGNSTGGQVDAISFSNGSSFTNYSEISINTGTSWDFSSLAILRPADNGHIKKKNGFYATIDLSLFSVLLDPTSEGGYFAPGTNIGSIPDNPVIIEGVTYGRTAIVAIESDEDFNTIKTAFQSVLNNESAAATQKLLNEATITLYMEGFNETETRNVKTATGYTQLSLFSTAVKNSGSYSANDYGSPIRFFAGTIADNTSVKYGFNYRLDYPIEKL